MTLVLTQLSQRLTTRQIMQLHRPTFCVRADNDIVL